MELYSLKRWILWNMNYISGKLIFKKITCVYWEGGGCLDLRVGKFASPTCTGQGEESRASQHLPGHHPSSTSAGRGFTRTISLFFLNTTPSPTKAGRQALMINTTFSEPKPFRNIHISEEPLYNLLWAIRTLPIEFTNSDFHLQPRLCRESYLWLLFLSRPISKLSGNPVGSAF